MNTNIFLPKSSTEFQIIGHRGSAGTSPENTLTSFRTAIDAGVTAIELDIHKVENHLVVIHDDTIDRTTNGKGPVSSFTFRDLRKFETAAGPIPTLDEVLVEVPPTIGINVELKGANTAQLAAQKLTNVDHAILISSFDHAQLQKFSDFGTGLAVAPLFHRWQKKNLSIAHELKALAINISRSIASQKVVTAIKNEGFRVYVYTVNEVKESQRMRQLGVDGIFSDFPQKIIES